MFFRHPYENNGGVFVFFHCINKKIIVKSQPLQSVKIARSSIGHNYHIYQPRFISVV